MTHTINQSIIESLKAGSLLSVRPLPSLFKLMHMEIWLPIIGYEGLYEISTYSNVKSLDKVRLSNYRGNRLEKGRVLKPFLNTQGYYRVSLTKDKKEWRPMVHNLMCATFLGKKKGRQNKTFRWCKNK